MIVIGTVAGPEDDELLKWAEHWKTRGHLLILVQGKPEWLNSDIAKQLLTIAPEATVIPVLPVGNPDVHWNSLMAIATTLPEYEGLLIKGTDEYMNDICWSKFTKLIKAQPDGAVFWMFRKDFYNGNHFETMAGGYQPTFVRGVPMTFSVNFHTYPAPACPVDAIRYLPEEIYVEHRRSLERVIATNLQRDGIARPNESATQNRFLDRLQDACKAAGIKYPEAGK